MVIQFTTKNFRSFSDAQTLSLEATAITEFPENLVEKKASKLKLLKGAVLYGSNSSGKSNFLRAMGAMRSMVLTSFNQSSSESILQYEPFLKKANQQKEPSFFEMVFLIENTIYRYGFELDSKNVVGEWLFQTTSLKKKEQVLFVRKLDGIEVMESFREGEGLEEKTRDNALFLSVVDQFNGQVAKKIMSWFNSFNVIDGISHKNYRKVTFSLLDKEETRKILMAYYKQLDLGFEDIRIVKEPFDSNKLTSGIPEDLLKQIATDLEGKTMVSMTAMHFTYDENNKPVYGKKNEPSMINFDVRQKESAGTNKIIDMSGPIFDTLRSGGVLVVDELDAKLHPLITMSIIRLFQDIEINRNNAQVIFATHDTNLLLFGRMRRDQIYFTEKNEIGATNLSSLVEYNVRKDRSFEKDYLDGDYGAIPFLGDKAQLKQYMETWLEKQK